MGLNPGRIREVAQYTTTSPVQSRYYWGSAPFQTGGPTGQVFDPNLARQIPAAGTQGWGMQSMAQPLTAQQLTQLLLSGGLSPLSNQPTPIAAPQAAPLPLPGAGTGKSAAPQTRPQPAPLGRRIAAVGGK